MTNIYSEFTNTDCEAKIRELQEIIDLQTQLFQCIVSLTNQIRTQCNTVMGYSRVLLKGIDGKLTEQQIADLHPIFRSGYETLELSNNILIATKAQLDIDNNLIASNAKNEIDRAIQIGNIFLEKKQLTLEVDVPKKLPLVAVDMFLHSSIFLCIFLTAIKHAQGQVIQVSGKRRENYVIEKVAFIGPREMTLPALAISPKTIESTGAKVWMETEQSGKTIFSIAFPILADTSCPGCKKDRAIAQQQSKTDK